MTETKFILAKVGTHPSDRMYLRFENNSSVWTPDRNRAAVFVDATSALALVDRETGPAYEGSVTFEAEPVSA